MVYLVTARHIRYLAPTVLVEAVFLPFTWTLVLKAQDPIKAQKTSHVQKLDGPYHWDILKSVSHIKFRHPSWRAISNQIVGERWCARLNICDSGNSAGVHFLSTIHFQVNPLAGSPSTSCRQLHSHTQEQQWVPLRICSIQSSPSLVSSCVSYPSTGTLKVCASS